MPLFNAHHYNVLAKEIREAMPDSELEPERDYRIIVNAQRGTLTALALNLARRFASDNPRFEPKRFLDACSSDARVYPLSELWESENDG